MVRLVHLNGPSGAGKSTLAQRYVDDHPGTLDLDIDVVVSLIGGWRDDFLATVSLARDIAIAMAETHLRSDRDVVMPQLVMSVAQAERFEQAAQRVGATYVEVALMVEPDVQISRFRSKARGSPPRRSCRRRTRSSTLSTGSRSAKHRTPPANSTSART